ncbi:MAG: electron transfer flavoprotein subunit beta/FixA family protein [Planctomycetes bacterium]|nr:electron transfer flavoprotein subunit beta/FixA family protein [Planctomycetota bacterium]
MKLVACVKRVPDTASPVRPAADGRSIDLGGVSFVLNPYDEYAVEECLRIKDARGGEVTVLSASGADASKELRHCLAMGADRAVLVKDAAVDRDARSTAALLAAALKGMPFDIAFFGRQAVDHDNAQVGLIVATLLGLPAVAEVSQVEVGSGAVTVRREAEGGIEVHEVPLPCVLTAQKGLNEPRYASLKGIMKAKKMQIEEMALEIPDSLLDVLRMEPPPPRPQGRVVGEGAAAVPALVRLLRDEAKVL